MEDLPRPPEPEVDLSPLMTAELSDTEEVSTRTRRRCNRCLKSKDCGDNNCNCTEYAGLDDDIIYDIYLNELRKNIGEDPEDCVMERFITFHGSPVHSFLHQCL